MTVRVGRTEINVTKTIFYGQSYFFSEDIAILQLNETLVFSDFVSPIALDDETPTEADECYLLSWGG